LSRPHVLIYRAVDESGDSHRLLEAAGCNVIVAPANADRARTEERARAETSIDTFESVLQFLPEDEASARTAVGLSVMDCSWSASAIS